MAKNYYFILGIPSDATLNQIKAAYRRRVKEYHPDHYTGGRQAFMDIQEAYSILSDPRTRKAYNHSLDEARSRRAPERHRRTPGESRPEPLKSRGQVAEPLRPGREPADLGEASLMRSFRTFAPSFDEIFDRLWNNFLNLSRPKAETLESLNVEIPLTPDQASRGGHIRILVPARAVCSICGGDGFVQGYECMQCAGEGWLTGDYPVLVSFPAGIVNGYIVQIPLARFGITNLYLTVRLRVSEEI